MVCVVVATPACNAGSPDMEDMVMLKSYHFSRVMDMVGGVEGRVMCLAIDLL